MTGSVVTTIFWILLFKIYIYLIKMAQQDKDILLEKVAFVLSSFVLVFILSVMIMDFKVAY